MATGSGGGGGGGGGGSSGVTSEKIDRYRLYDSGVRSAPDDRRMSSVWFRFGESSQK
jgi:hypothetical protein